MEIGKNLSWKGVCMVVVLINSINQDKVVLNLKDITPTDLGHYTSVGYEIIEYRNEA